MAVVIAVFHQGRAIFRNRRAHELADQTAEICSHHEGFQSVHFLGAKPAVDEAQENQKFFHRFLNVSSSEAVRKNRSRIKPLRVHRYWRTCFFLGVFCYGHDFLAQFSLFPHVPYGNSVAALAETGRNRPPAKNCCTWLPSHFRAS